MQHANSFVFLHPFPLPFPSCPPTCWCCVVLAQWPPAQDRVQHSALSGCPTRLPVHCDELLLLLPQTRKVRGSCARLSPPSPSSMASTASPPSGTVVAAAYCGGQVGWLLGVLHHSSFCVGLAASGRSARTTQRQYEAGWQNGVV